MNKKIYLVAPLFIIVGVIGVFFTAKDFFARESINGEESFSSTEIDYIVIDSAVANVRVVPSESDNIGVEWEGSLFKSTLGNGTVSIEEDASTLEITIGEHRFFDFFTLQIPFDGLDVTIYLPDKQFNSIALENDVGNTHISSVNTEQLHAESNVSDMRIENVNANLLEAESDVGLIKLKNVTGKLYVVNDVGNIEVTVPTIPANVSFSGDTSLGTTTIFGEKGSLIGNQAEYMVQMHSDVGNIDVMAQE